MGRKRKRKDYTNTIGIIVLIIAVLVYIKLTFLKDFNPLKDFDFKLPKKEIVVTERSVEEDYTEVKTEAVENNQQADKYVEVFFAKSLNGKDIYVAAPRTKQNNTVSNIEYAVVSLLKGPNKTEKNSGVYSEIPPSTKLIYIKEKSDRILINLSSDFEFGGGGDSLYKRMYQLIKTVNKNSTKPVYLLIDGKQVNVLGGEGLMLKQPLRSNSLDD